MTHKPFKIILLGVLILTTLFFTLNIYLSKHINAEEEVNNNKLTIISPSLNLTEPKANTQTNINSIVQELDIPSPTTKTYKEFTGREIKDQKKKIRKVFKIPKSIEPEVNFWRDIYTKYDKTKVVFHDKKHLDIIYSVLDVSKITNNENLSDKEKYKRKKKLVTDEEDRITTILFGLGLKNSTDLTKDEKMIYDLFDNVRERNKFKKAAGRVRSQTGIRDKFIEGINVSGKYLGEIEKIFGRYNIPLEISRLAFVESMFNLEALSKVGASGIWQFMPSTGKLFMTINKFVDERNDPILATHAAAKHLLRDYETLGSWPLAINAYNTGPGRISRAVNKLGTTKIATIIKKFDHSGYGFASRNFYPAFLAALDAFENRDKYLGKIEMQKPLKFDEIKIPFFCSFTEIAEYTKVPVEDLTLLNPHLQNEVISGKMPLPKDFILKVPPSSGNAFLTAFNELEKEAKQAKWHIVKSNENLKTIAAKYKTSANKIKRINLLRKNRVQTGQILKLPKDVSLAKE